MTRLSWERYALGIADAASRRSEDPYVRVGACILRADHSVASVGFNGSPSGISIDWSDRDARRPKVIHAESNALRYTRPGEGVLLATTMLSCLECVKLTASYGIKQIVFSEYYASDSYNEDATRALAEEFGVELNQVKGG